MPVLATETIKDITRLYEQANGQFENDLVETIVVMRNRILALKDYISDLKLISDENSKRNKGQ